MNSLQDSFKTGMAMFWAMLLAVNCESYRPAIEPELEKELGRKPTDDEWHYFLKECIKKAHVDRQQQQFRQWYQRLADRKMIYDLVWGNNQKFESTRGGYPPDPPNSIFLLFGV